MSELNSCECGGRAVPTYEPSDDADYFDVEFIVCDTCGNTVYGLDGDSYKQWNNREYDD